MTLRHIQIFIAVCESGSTVKASDRLNLAQPSISLAVKELEQYYGIKLFDRISRRLILNEAGINFLKYAREINNNFLSLETQIKDYDKTKELAIGASISIGIFILPKLIKSFKQTYPTTDLNIEIKDTESIVKLIIENKIDIGLIESTSKSASNLLTSIPFYQDKLVLVVSVQNPLANKSNVILKDIESQQLILRESHSAGRSLINTALSSKNIETKNIWESVSNEAILSMVSQNLGISILPNGVIDNHLLKNKVKKITISDVDFKRTYSIIHHKNKYLTHGANDFILLSKALKN